MTLARRPLFTAMSAVSAFLTFSSTCWAGAVAPCEMPMVFGGAAVNVVVLPFTGAQDQDGRFSAAGLHLAVLVKLHTLFSILKYQSVGAVCLVPRSDPNVCTEEIVSQKLLGRIRGAEEEVEPGHGVVIIWGRFYQEGDSLYVQTYARFLRRDAPDRFGVALSPSSPAKLEARTPFDAVAFEAHRVTVRDLVEIEDSFRRSAVVRTERNENIAGTPLLGESPGAWGRNAVSGMSRSLAYSVTEARPDGWMKVESRSGGPHGWVRARTGEDSWPLAGKLPELDFIDALVGYLRLRVGNVPKGSKVPESCRRYIEQALDRFERRGEKTPPRVAALGRILRGNLALLQAVGNRSAFGAALSSYHQATQLIPYSSDARNLELLASAGSTDSPKSAAALLDLASEYVRTLAAEPANQDVLTNIETLYRAALAMNGDQIDPTLRRDVERRAATVAAVRSKLKTPK